MSKSTLASHARSHIEHMIAKHNLCHNKIDLQVRAKFLYIRDDQDGATNAIEKVSNASNGINYTKIKPSL